MALPSMMPQLRYSYEDLVNRLYFVCKPVVGVQGTRLDKDGMFNFAKLLQYDDSDAKWEDEYLKICKEP